MPVRFNPTEVATRVREAARRGLVKSTEAVRNEAISLILNTPKTGRVYYRRGVEHVASAPGEAPASDTGRLVNSIRTVYDFSSMTGQVVVSAAYGAHLEFGTQKMAPRPFLRPALANTRAQVRRIMQEEIRQALRRR